MVQESRNSDQNSTEQAQVSDDILFAVRLRDAIASHSKDADSISPIKSLLEVGGQQQYQWIQDSSGRTPLHQAAELGHLDIVRLLVEVGHPWNALDDSGRCGAQLAEENGHTQVHSFLLQEAVRAQMILSLTEDTEEGNDGDDVEYLRQNVEYSEGDQLLLDDAGDAVMMEWERPLMKKHAALICGLDGDFDFKDNSAPGSSMPSYESLPQMPTKGRTDGDAEPFKVLNVGFGLGIVDTYIHLALAERARREPNRRFVHYVMEAHAGVLQKMESKGWYTRSDTCPELVVLKGRWDHTIKEIYENAETSGDYSAIPQFDGIFFDTFGDDYKDLKNWHESMVGLLKSDPESVYSFFNGLAGRNDFFNQVASQVAELDLGGLGLAVEWQEVPVSIDEREWTNIKHRYFTLSKYRLPVCRWIQDW